MVFPPMPMKMLKTIQESMMGDTVAIYRGEFGDEYLVSEGIPCRIDANRLFAEPADPYDANVRSLSEWTLITPSGTDIKISDIVRVDRPMGSPIISIVAIVGELVEGHTHQLAQKFFCTRPKSAVPNITLILEREIITYDDSTDEETSEWIPLDPQEFQLVFKRVDPEDTPLRYMEGGRSSYQGATLVGPLGTDIRNGDRFSYIDPNTDKSYSGTVLSVLPIQPQRIEARVLIDVFGDL